MTELVSYLTRQRAHTPQEKSDNKQKPKEVRVRSVMCIWLIYYWVTDWMNEWLIDQLIHSFIDNYVFAELLLLIGSNNSFNIGSIQCMVAKASIVFSVDQKQKRNHCDLDHVMFSVLTTRAHLTLKRELRDEIFLQLSSTISGARRNKLRVRERERVDFMVS